MGAAPLWAGDGLNRPALLRLNADRFMDALRHRLATAPSTLTALVATRESHAVPPYDKIPEVLKLFQPVHGRVELAVASLVCVLPGLPDHHVAPATDEVGFVVRRVDGAREWAWLPTTGRPNFGRWLEVRPDELGQRDGETEQIVPAFPLYYQEGERKRQLWAGQIPTASQDAWEDAPTPSGEADPDLPSRWIAELQARFLDPMQMLLDAPTKSDAQTEGIAMTLLDLLLLLERDLPEVAARIAEGRAAAGHAVIEALQELWLDDTDDRAEELTWWEALPVVDAYREVLLGLASGAFERSWTFLEPDAAEGTPDPWRALMEALKTSGPAHGPAADLPARARLEPGATYHVRFVYRTPPCPHRRPLVLSAVASTAFTVAGVYDPDAPARQVRISLPESPSANHLRRYPKSVSFVASPEMRKKMSAVADLKGLLEGNAGSEGDDGWGEICSISLPTITLCATFVLNIFLGLFNIAFFWLPFIKLCLPVPKSVASKVPQ